jgi:hypothetical protein
MACGEPFHGSRCRIVRVGHTTRIIGRLPNKISVACVHHGVQAVVEAGSGLPVLAVPAHRERLGMRVS